MIETAAEVDNILLENKVGNKVNLEPFLAFDIKIGETAELENNAAFLY